LSGLGGVGRLTRRGGKVQQKKKEKPEGGKKSFDDLQQETGWEKDVIERKIKRLKLRSGGRTRKGKRGTGNTYRMVGPEKSTP